MTGTKSLGGRSRRGARLARPLPLGVGPACGPERGGRPRLTGRAGVPGSGVAPCRPCSSAPRECSPRATNPSSAGACGSGPSAPFCLGPAPTGGFAHPAPGLQRPSAGPGAGSKKLGCPGQAAAGAAGIEVSPASPRPRRRLAQGGCGSQWASRPGRASQTFTQPCGRWPGPGLLCVPAFLPATSHRKEPSEGVKGTGSAPG